MAYHKIEGTYSSRVGSLFNNMQNKKKNENENNYSVFLNVNPQYSELNTTGVNTSRSASV